MDKVYFFRCIVEPVLLYGAVTWTITETFKHEIDAAYYSMLRHILHIHWDEHRSNNEIMQEFKIDPITDVLSWHRLKFYGSCYPNVQGTNPTALLKRMQQQQPIHDLLFYCPWLSESRSKGKCRIFTYVDQIIQDYGHSKANGNISNTDCLSYIESIKKNLGDKSTWYKVCDKHCKELCPYTYERKEEQKKRRKEALKKNVTSDSKKLK